LLAVAEGGGPARILTVLRDAVLFLHQRWRAPGRARCADHPEGAPPL